MLPSDVSIGSLVERACTWEVQARKLGNVCPGREYPDLTVADFRYSAVAIAPVLDKAPRQPLGVTILRAVGATRAVVATNTNLGIVLLLAPLASVPVGQPLMPGLGRILAQTTVDDARHVYAAIRLANPGGLGAAPQQDVRDQPTLPLRDVMALAQDRDLIALQYVNGFAHVRAWSQRLGDSAARHGNIERAIFDLQLAALAETSDSLIARKCGVAEAERVREIAVELSQTPNPPGKAARLREFDALLRADNHARNPGTIADLIAAALFVALRDGRLDPSLPFTWDEHPFV
ncbi:MAG TPA: triphosphoribosyl-dephospho-CoA synthase [Gemmataceae bacterium]|nr:triphosphoribosyl-dephospho-CoA synthase [Gemmataceae bacterium]